MALRARLVLAALSLGGLSRRTARLWLALCALALPFIVLSPPARALPSVGSATVTGRVLDWSSQHLPLSGCRVELRSATNQLIAVRTTNSAGNFTFTNVPTTSNASFRVHAFVGYHSANWYFTLSPGQTRTLIPWYLSP